MPWECACGIENRDSGKPCGGCGWSKSRSDEYKLTGPKITLPQKHNSIPFAEIPNHDIPSEILACKDKNERILWIGRPDSAIAFALSSGALQPMFLGILLIAVFVFGTQNIYGILFGLMMLSPILGYIVTAENTRYAVSDRRVIIKTGFLNRAVYTLDYDQIGDVTTNASAFEIVFGVGSVMFGSYAFKSIRDFENIASMVKSTAVDVKTDWNYPNAKRPEKNPGYGTTYEI